MLYLPEILSSPVAMVTFDQGLISGLVRVRIGAWNVQADCNGWGGRS